MKGTKINARKEGFPVRFPSMSIKILPANPFPENFLDAFQLALHSRLAAGADRGPTTAVFDADGTLWKTDVGELFFDFVIEHKAQDLKVPLPKDPWSHYLNLKRQGRQPEAYLWLAQIFEGLTLAQVREIASEFKDRSSPVPVFKPVLDLLSVLKDHAVEVYIVTASVKWAVEPHALELNIPQSRVIGIETEVDSIGRLGLQARGPISWREGKLKKFQEVSGALQPDFAFGNTLGDRWLIESAAGFSACFRSEAPGSRVFDEEEALFQWAEQNQWHRHHF